MAVKFPGGNNNFISMITGTVNTATKNQSALTAMAWVRWDVINAIQTIAVWSTPTATSTRLGIKMIATGALQVIARALDADALTSINTTSTTLITQGVWFHFAAAVNIASGSAAIYLNGVAQAIDPFVNNFGAAATSNTNGVLQRIGCAATINTEILTGAIEDVRLYQRIVGPAEMMTIYTAQGVDHIVQNLANRYPLKELSQGLTFANADNIAPVDQFVGTTAGALQYDQSIITPRRPYKFSLTYPDL
jgi:hypothetical protein